VQAAHRYAQKSAQRHGKDHTVIIQHAVPDPVPIATKSTAPVPSEVQDDRVENSTMEDFDTTSSIYSGSTQPEEYQVEEYHQEVITHACVSPLRLPRDQESVDPSETRSVLANYNNWRSTPVDPSVSSGGPPTSARGDGSVQNYNLHSSPTEEPFFSPLTPFFQTEGLPTTRKSKKDLMGDNGWLEKTTVAEVQKPTEPKVSPRKAGFFGGLIKKAKGMVSE
jgi:hypothetical protein